MTDESANGCVWVVILLACIAAWLTHIFVCLVAGKWGFLIAGALFFPIAVVHGIGVWIGLF